MLTRSLFLMICLAFVMTMHELGHYVVGRCCGIRVRKFAVFLDLGFHIFSSHDGWFVRLFPGMLKRTEFVIGWLPVAAYVRFETEGEDAPYNTIYQNAKAWKRLLVSAAGPLMNYLWCVILTIALVFYYHPRADNPAVIKFGVELANHRVARMVPDLCESYMTDFRHKTESIKKIGGQKEVAQRSNVSETGTDSQKRGGWYQLASRYPDGLDIPRLLSLSIFLNIFLMLFNLIPVLPLDGGNMLFCAYETVLRRKPNERVRIWLSVIGFAVLAVLTLWNIIEDLMLDFV